MSGVWCRALQYSKKVGTTDILDGTVYLNPPLQADSRLQHTVKIVDIQIPSRIPNIFNFGGTNTGLVRVSNGTTTINIQLDDGVYSATSLSNAINSVIETWYSDITNPAFTIEANTTVSKLYITIDSSKLNVAGQFTINFNYNNSKMYELLGFSAVKEFTTDGIFTSDVYPKMNYFGDSIECQIGGFGSLMLKNGAPSEQIATIPIIRTTSNAYYYPSNGLIPPEIPCRVGSSVNSFTVKFIGRDKQCIAYDGDVIVNFVITEYPK